MKLNYVFIILVLFVSNIELSAQQFNTVDRSPHDIAYYRPNKISPPIIKVLYGRPQKNGREIFGKLVPYDKVWRLGANEATEITFFQDVLFGGKEVKKGTYVMYAIPQEKEWAIILNSNLDVWGTYEYEEKYDIARVKAKVSKAESIEAFSIGFKDKNDKVLMVFAWDNTRVKVPVKL